MQHLQLFADHIDGHPAIRLGQADIAAPRQVVPARCWGGLRDGLLRMLVHGIDITAVAAAANRTGDGNLHCRVILPPGAMEKLQSGQWQLKDSLTGQGKVPWIADESGKIIHQVRLDDLDWGHGSALDPQSLVAAGQAATHAMLMQIADQLDELSEQVGELLQNDKYRWWADIGAGVDLFHEVGEDRLHDPRVSESRQLISRGVKEGWFHVDRSVRKVAAFRSPSTVDLLFSTFGLRKVEDVATRGQVIDELRHDLENVVRGTVALVRLHEHQDEFELARSKAAALAYRLANVAKEVGPRLRLAPHNPARAATFHEVLPALTRDPDMPHLVLETSTAELEALAGAP